MNKIIGKHDKSESGVEHKHYHMKQFIIAAKEYSSTRTEDTAAVINRHLQVSPTLEITKFAFFLLYSISTIFYAME